MSRKQENLLEKGQANVVSRGNSNAEQQCNAGDIIGGNLLAGV